MTNKVVILCSEGLKLDALLGAWAESALGKIELSLVSVVEQDSVSALYDGRPLLFNLIDDFDFSGVNLVVNLESDLVVEAYKEILLSLNCTVLGFYADLAALDPELFTEGVKESGAVVGIPGALVSLLKMLLPGSQAYESVDLTVFNPVSLYGQAGVEELAGQTARLLNAQPLEHKVFVKQMPFNYFPMSAGQLGQQLERQFKNECGAVFPGLEAYIAAVQMPVFYGTGVRVSAVFAEKADLDQIKDGWQASDVVSIDDTGLNLSNYDVMQSEGRVLLGNISASEHDDYRLDFWLGFDEVEFAIAKLLMNSAEILLKHEL